MIRRAIVFVSAAVLSLWAGCGGKPEQETIGFGEASAERKEQFAVAVAAALKGFEDLDSQGVQIVVADKDSLPQVTVRGGRIQPAELEKALAVALTNMAFKYPGIGFMATGDGGWRILMPDEMKIPRMGEFGLEVK